jgi:sugar phosphate permease
MAVFYGATFPIYGACAGDYFPREAIGTVAGSWTPFYGSGAILTHWVTGGLRDVTGGYDLAFLICALMAGASIVLMARVRGRPQRGGGAPVRGRTNDVC